MKPNIRSLILVAALILPAQAFAADGITLAQQQGQYPPGAMQGQPPQQQQQGQQQQGQQGQPQQQGQQGTPRPKGGQGGQPSQQQGMPIGGSPGIQQPRSPINQPPTVVVQPPAIVIQQPGMAPPPPPPGRSPNRQYNAVLRCNQRQASCSQNCNRRTYGQARNICNNQCNAAFVNCTTRANGMR
jgi:hypothetical protein